MEPSVQPERFLRISDLTKQVGLCRSSIYNFIRKSDFPRPVRIGSRSSRWRLSEVEKWQSRQAEPAPSAAKSGEVRS